MKHKKEHNGGKSIIGSIKPSDIVCAPEVFEVADDIVKEIRESGVEMDLNTVHGYVEEKISRDRVGETVTVEKVSRVVRGILESADLLNCAPDLDTVLKRAEMVDDFRNPLPNIALRVRDILRKKPDHTKKLRDLSSLLIVEAKSLDEVFAHCLETALEVSGMDSGGIYIVNEDGSLTLMKHKGFNTLEFVAGVSHYPVDSSNARFIRQRKPFYMNYEALVHTLRKIHFVTEGLNVIAVIPIVHEDRLFACLNLASHSGKEILPAVRNAVEMVADYIAIYIDRELTQRNLRESEHKLRSIIEGSKDAIIVVGENGKIEIFNPAATQMFGVSDISKVIGQPVTALLPDEFKEKHEGDMVSYLEGGTSAEAIGKTLTLPAVKEDGTKITIELSLSAVEGERKMLVADVRDVSEKIQAQMEKERLQTQLAQAQKMEAVGRLAGGVAHDFNNMLTAVTGFASLATYDVKANNIKGILEHMGDIMKIVSRATELTKQLLAFGRVAVLRPMIVSLNKVIEDEALPVCRRIVRENISFETKLMPDLRYIKVDPTQMQQILLNFVINAMDAIRETGTITVKTRNVSLDDSSIKNYGLATNQCVELSVSDNGEGISADVIGHIFEPFFTTKEVGRGTGLGLATVHGIVKQSGGHITVESGHDKGTTFRIYFPVYSRISGSDHLALKPIGESENYEILRGNETLLLVEDEESIRRSNKIFGKKLGYRVLSATNGNDALEIMKKEGDKIDVVITDMVMPCMGGLELIKKIKELNSSVKTILVSGYPKDSANGVPETDDDTVFISKPFSPPDLFIKIRSMIDAE